MVNRWEDRVVMSIRDKVKEAIQDPGIAASRVLNSLRIVGQRRRLGKLPTKIGDPLLGHRKEHKRKLWDQRLRYPTNPDHQAGMAGQTTSMDTVLGDANRRMAEE